MRQTTTTLLSTSLFLLVAGSVASAQESAASPAAEFALRNAQELREMARYPLDLRLIPGNGRDPIRDRLLAEEPRELGDAKSGDARIAAWSARTSFEYPAPVKLFARVVGVGVHTIFGSVAARDSGVEIGLVEYRDDGLGGDTKAGDGVFTAELEMPDDQVSGPVDLFVVTVEADPVRGDPLHARDFFIYSRPSAHLTGRYRDRVEDGNLKIEVEVDVEKPGRFHLEATLSGADDAPIAWTQVARRLEPGKHWLELDYYGLVFHDRHAQGRFRLATVVLSTTTAHLTARCDPVIDAYTTRPYELEQFTSRPFNDPALLKAAKDHESRARALTSRTNGR